MRALLDYLDGAADALRRGDPPPPPDDIIARFAGIPPPPSSPAVRPQEGKLNLALIRREYPPETAFGGMATFTYHLARGLSDAGHRVTVITGGTPLFRHDHNDCVDVVQMEPRLADARDSFTKLHRRGWLSWGAMTFLHSLAALRAVRELEAAHGPFDILDLGDHGGDGLGPALYWNGPKTVRLHGPWTILTSILGNAVPEFESRVVPLFESALLQRAAVITAPSRDMADRTRTYFDLSTTVVPIPNPIDIDLFCPTPHPSQDQAVCFVGRLESAKGIHTLLEAIPQVLARAPDVEFEIVGPDPDNLAAKVAPADLPRVRFRGRMPLTALPTIYQRSALCVVPSWYDNSPNTAIEAMACGIPVVATSAGGTPEYVRDGGTGLIVPPRDANALADAIIRLATDTSLRHAMGRAARTWVETSLTIPVVTALMEQQYRIAVSGDRSAPGDLAPVRIDLNTSRPGSNRVDAVILAGIEDGEDVAMTVANVQEQGATPTLVWDGPIGPPSPSPDGRTVGSSRKAGADAARILSTLLGQCFFILGAGDRLPDGWLDRARRELVASGKLSVTMEGRSLVVARAARGLLLGDARTWDDILDRVAARPVVATSSPDTDR
jgi:glycosyltransferase involved in cell wall biosynthesis